MKTAFRILAAVLLCLASPMGLLGGEMPDRPPKEPRMGSKERAEARKLIKAYFEATEAGEKAALLETMKGFDPISRRSARTLKAYAFRCAYAGPKRKLESRTRLETAQGTGQILVSGVKRGRAQPLLIGLHGGGAGTGDGATSRQKWQSATGKGCICVFPTVLKKEDSAWNKEREERYVLEIIEAVKRSTRVDTNRIYLVGHSMGGFGTWSIGAHHADLFAAISPNAGGIFAVRGSTLRLASGILPNLYNTPVYFFHSTDDPQVPAATDQRAAKELARLREEHPGGYEHVYKEYDDIGHGMPPTGVRPILEYLLEHKRDPYPAKVIFEPSRATKRLFAWVEVPAGSGVSWICAEYDRKSNEISVQTKGGDTGFAVYLAPRAMFDIKKKVTVKVNGTVKFEAYVQRSLVAMIRSIGAFFDMERVYEIRIGFP